MCLANPSVPYSVLRITRTEPDGMFHEGECLLYRPRVKFALRKVMVCVPPVAIERDHCLGFGNGLLAATLRSQHRGFRLMRSGVAGRCRQGLRCNPFCTLEVGSGRIGLSVEHAD